MDIKSLSEADKKSLLLVVLGCEPEKIRGNTGEVCDTRYDEVINAVRHEREDAYDIAINKYTKNIKRLFGEG